MEIQAFKETKGHWDLTLVFLYSVGLLSFIYLSHQDNNFLLAAPVLLMGMGYPISFLLSSKKVFSGKRLAWSVAISCLLSTGMAISIPDRGSIIIIAAAITFAGSIFAVLIRSPEHTEQVSRAFDSISNVISQSTRANRRNIMTKILALIIFFSTLALVGLIATSPPMYNGYTELYITGPDGKPNSVPRDVVGQTNFSIIIGLVNHEKVDVSYEVQVWLINSSTVNNWTEVSAAYFLDKINVHLPHVDPSEGGSWKPQFETEMTFNLNISGSFKLFFLLSKEGDPELPSNPVRLNNYAGYEIESLINRARMLDIQSVNINLNISEPLVQATKVSRIL